jgi:hypothetical protein
MTGSVGMDSKRCACGVGSAAPVVAQSDLLQVHVNRLKTFRTFRDNRNPATKTVVEFIIQMESVLHRSDVIKNDSPEKTESDPTQAAERLIVRKLSLAVSQPADRL